MKIRKMVIAAGWGTRFLPATKAQHHCLQVDTTEPNNWIRQTLLPYMQEYWRILFSMPEYHLEGIDPARVSVFPPAIDLLSLKNMPYPREEAREKLANLGIDSARPLVSQVSRFDRWKDPWGVIDAYRLARERVPDLRLVLVDAMSANDDSDAMDIFRSVQQHAANDPDVHLFSLMPRLLRDYLRLILRLVDSKEPSLALAA